MDVSTLRVGLVGELLWAASEAPLLPLLLSVGLVTGTGAVHWAESRRRRDAVLVCHGAGSTESVRRNASRVLVYFTFATSVGLALSVPVLANYNGLAQWPRFAGVAVAAASIGAASFIAVFGVTGRDRDRGAARRPQRCDVGDRPRGCRRRARASSRRPEARARRVRADLDPQIRCGAHSVWRRRPALVSRAGTVGRSRRDGPRGVGRRHRSRLRLRPARVRPDSLSTRCALPSLTTSISVRPDIASRSDHARFPWDCGRPCPRLRDPRQHSSGAPDALGPALLRHPGRHRGGGDGAAPARRPC
jgi:hypothetical protein